MVDKRGKSAKAKLRHHAAATGLKKPVWRPFATILVVLLAVTVLVFLFHLNGNR